MSSLAGKIIILTGSAGAFGRAFSEKILKKGCKVLMCDINREEGENCADEMAVDFGTSMVKFAQCDVTDVQSLKGAFQSCIHHYGKIDVVVNNAGCVMEDDLQANVNVNLIGTIRGTEMAFEYMGKDKGHEGGRVINIAGHAGLSNVPYFPYYSTTKSAVIHYTRVLGHQFHYDYTGVIVQCLCPSLVRSPLLEVTMARSYNQQCGVAATNLIKKAPLIEIDEVTNSLFTLIEDNKPGSVMAVEVGKRPYYIQPSIQT